MAKELENAPISAFATGEAMPHRILITPGIVCPRRAKHVSEHGLTDR